MKKYLFGILAVVIVAGVSAFTVKKAHKPVFSSQDFYYKKDAATGRQRIEFNAYTTYQTEADADPAVAAREKSTLNDPSYNTSNATAFETVGNWSTVAADAYTSTAPTADDGDGASYAWKFTLNLYEAGASNGYADGGASLEEAVKAITDYRESHSNSLPAMPYTLPGTNTFGVAITSMTQSDVVHQ